MEKHVLGLELPTDPRWVNIAEMNIQEILVDHAWCEQKAASTCISLIIQYPNQEKLVEMLTPIVAEEWNHFERVLSELKKRGFALGPARKDEYVEGVMAIMKTGRGRTELLVEKLLMSALIEARSCERFRLLWREISDEGLRQFYYELMVSEAGHYKNFLSLAKEYMDADKVMERWREILVAEAEVVKALGVRGDRMH
jgi:tRNA 2-(methylsulfanyl)-N6-isopentenyladenosine37 hydroxylase